jgi:hypothetical protein
LEGYDLLVDVLELSIAVGMMAAFLGLAIDLPAVEKAFEQSRSSRPGRIVS